MELPVSDPQFPHGKETGANRPLTHRLGGRINEKMDVECLAWESGSVGGSHTYSL